MYTTTIPVNTNQNTSGTTPTLPTHGVAIDPSSSLHILSNVAYVTALAQIDCAVYGYHQGSEKWIQLGSQIGVELLAEKIWVLEVSAFAYTRIAVINTFIAGAGADDTISNHLTLKSLR